MKYRIGFVTNSSSSSFVAIHIDSEILQQIFNKEGSVLSVFEDLSKELVDDGVCVPVTPSLSESIKSILDTTTKVYDYGYIYEDHGIDAKAIERIKKAIDQTQDLIDSEATCSLISVEGESEAPGFISSKELVLTNGKGKFITFGKSNVSVNGIGNLYPSIYVDEMPELARNNGVIHEVINGKTEKCLQDSKKQDDVLTFVITGKLDNYTRDEIVEIIEDMGGRVTNSVTKKTTYVVTNTPDSNTAKIKKAKELGIPIISEDDLEDIISENY